MRILNKEELKLEQNRVMRHIREGAIIIYPTDTIYGIGCNALDSKAVDKLRQIKNRYEKPFSVIAPSVQWIYDNCYVDKKAEEWIKKLPGPYTLILKLKNKNAVSSNTNMGFDTLGIRIPDHWCSKAVQKTNVPLITTSANVSGGDFMTSLENLDPLIRSSVDYVINEGEKVGHPSQIIDLTGEKEKIQKR